MRKKIYILLFIITHISINITANNLLLKGDSAYMAEDYQAAVDAYEQAINDIGASSELYYNLGNAYYKIEDFGKAILYYNRSLKQDPSNQYAKNNLELVRSKVNDLNAAELKGKQVNIVADEPSFFEKIYNAISKDTHSDTWAIWAIVTFLLLIAAISTYIFINNVMIRKVGFFSGIVMLILTLVFIVFSFLSAEEYEKDDKGVVISFSVPLKSEAKEQSEDIFIPFHRGTEFEIMEEFVDVNNERWYKVRINKNIAGWINEKDIEAV